jgi:hypothetical protein
MSRTLPALIVVVAAGVLGAFGVASAQASSLCVLSAGPSDYQSALSPLLGRAGPTPPTPPGEPPLPAPRPGPGAFEIARAALGAQFAGGWVNNEVQGWVVGLAPGPLDVTAAHAAIVQALGQHFAGADLAELTSRLHVDPQPYSDDELDATADAVTNALVSAQLGVGWTAGAGGCMLSDARRVEVELFSDSTPAIVDRVTALVAPFGDEVRLAVHPYGPPVAVTVPGGTEMPPALPHSQPQGTWFASYVRMPLAGRCVHAAGVGVLTRARRPAVRSLTVKAGGRTRTIRGLRLRKPLVVALRAKRTLVVVTVRLADGRTATRSPTYVRCG